MASPAALLTERATSVPANLSVSYESEGGQRPAPAARRSKQPRATVAHRSRCAHPPLLRPTPGVGARLLSLLRVRPRISRLREQREPRGPLASARDPAY